jgi:P27 family predicted phage terminase small subunit
VIKPIDKAVLVAYCSAYAHWWNAENQLKGMDDVITTAHGNQIQNPYLSISNRSMELMVKFAAELGMTPSSRARLVADKPTEEDKMAGFLFGKNVKVVK